MHIYYRDAHNVVLIYTRFVGLPQSQGGIDWMRYVALAKYM